MEWTPLQSHPISGGHVRRNLPIHQAPRELSIATAGIGRDRIWLPALPLGEASNHVLRSSDSSCNRQLAWCALEPTAGGDNSP